MYDDDGYYVILPDPDTLPEPQYEGWCWDEIVEDLNYWDAYYREAEYWNEQARRAEEEVRYMNEYYNAFEADRWDDWGYQL
jgi:hypothetical protein